MVVLPSKLQVDSLHAVKRIIMKFGCTRHVKLSAVGRMLSFTLTIQLTSLTSIKSCTVVTSVTRRGLDHTNTVSPARAAVLKCQAERDVDVVCY